MKSQHRTCDPAKMRLRTKSSDQTSLEEFSSAAEIEMKTACFKAYDKLSEEEKAAIDQICDQLTAAIKAEHPTTRQLGKLSRLELIAKIGLWIGDHERKNKTTD